ARRLAGRRPRPSGHLPGGDRPGGGGVRPGPPRPGRAAHPRRRMGQTGGAKRQGLGAASPPGRPAGGRGAPQGRAGRAGAAAAAESLSAAERRELIVLLAAGLDDPPRAEAEGGPPLLSEAWRREVARRSAEYDAGRAETVTWQEVQARWQARRAVRPTAT